MGTVGNPCSARYLPLGASTGLASVSEVSSSSPSGCSRKNGDGAVHWYGPGKPDDELELLLPQKQPQQSLEPDDTPHAVCAVAGPHHEGPALVATCQ